MNIVHPQRHRGTRENMASNDTHTDDIHLTKTNIKLSKENAGASNLQADCTNLLKKHEIEVTSEINIGSQLTAILLLVNE